MEYVYFYILSDLFNNNKLLFHTIHTFTFMYIASLWISTSSIHNQKSRIIRNQVKPQLRHLILPMKKVFSFRTWSKLLQSGLSHFRRSGIYLIYILSICCIFSEFDLTSGWETIKNNVEVNQSVAVLDLGSNELPLTQGEDGEQVWKILNVIFAVPTNNYV